MRIVLLCALAVCAWADEVTDRAAVQRVVESLNRVTPAPDIFTGDAYSELDNLPVVPVKDVRMVTMSDTSAVPQVRISPAVWGEADIVYPALRFETEVINPRIVSKEIRFVGPAVALAEGSWTDGERTIPLIFVLHKHGEEWRIASARVL